MRVVGKDATPLQGRGGNDLTYLTDTVHISPGESLDAIFVAPDVSSETRLLLHDRRYKYTSNPGMSGYGGQITEVHILPAGQPLPEQTEPNT